MRLGQVALRDLPFFFFFFFLVDEWVWHVAWRVPVWRGGVAIRYARSSDVSAATGQRLLPWMGDIGTELILSCTVDPLARNGIAPGCAQSQSQLNEGVTQSDKQFCVCVCVWI